MTFRDVEISVVIVPDRGRDRTELLIENGNRTRRYHGTNSHVVPERNSIENRRPRVKMLVFIALLVFAHSSVGSAQVWEQEITFTGSKTIRITLPPNAATGSQQASNSVAKTPSSESSADPLPSPFSDTFLDSIQKLNSSWQISQNFDESMVQGYLTSLTGLHPDFRSHMPSLPKSYEHNNDTIPEEFDARKQWPNCPTIQEIRDQGSCGSCWAISTAEAMSDRFCIHSNTSHLFHFSVEDLVSCCTSCGYGCDGGYPGEAWNYLKDTGVVSGGDYGSEDADRGCKPYSIEPCEHHTQGSRKQCTQSVPTPKCNRTCVEGYNVTYKEDLYFGVKAYSVENKVETIQREILTNGPVVASYEVYEDFLSYGDGVYQHVQGNKVGGHAVKVIGWGVDQASKLPYWLVANSWNTNWGKLGGFFKIKRGNNECNFERDITAGMPKFDKNTSYTSA